jgi:Domain of unknown function (DUF4352)
MHPLSSKKSTAILNICGALAIFLLLSACGGAGNTNSATPTIQSGTVAANTPGVGPIIVQSTPTAATTGTTPTATRPGATPDPGQGQVIKLGDRTLTMGQVSKQAGTDASSTSISLTITVTNTSLSSILNQATFYQLEGAEGDAFGTQSSVSANFYGSIPPRGSRQGTIVFQIPTGAVKGIHLLFRPEVATDTALIPLNI